MNRHIQPNQPVQGTDTAQLSEDESNRSRKLRRFKRALLSNHLMLVGLCITLIMVIVAMAAPLIATHDPLRASPRDRLQAPSAEHWMGTDNHGRDLFSRTIYGSRVSIRVGAVVIVMASVVGTFMGLVAGYFPKLDGPIMRLMDGLMAFPGILLAIAILAALGPREFNVMIALSVTYSPRLARVVRGQVLSLRELEYVEAVQAAGASSVRVIMRHILPNTLSPLIVQATFILALAILAEAGLSYIGAGTPPPTPTWGNILSEGGQYMYQAPWMTIFPGLFIMITVLGINLLGDGLRDLLDPRM